MAETGKYGAVEIERVGADEPVFVLRAQDELALDAIRVYLEMALQNDRPAGFVAGLEAEIDRFETWQHQNRELVKPPD